MLLFMLQGDRDSQPGVALRQVAWSNGGGKNAVVVEMLGNANGLRVGACQNGNNLCGRGTCFKPHFQDYFAEVFGHLQQLQSFFVHARHNI